jgi:hypothetical protein
MPMTPFLSMVANVLEGQFRPGLAEFVEREYKARSGNQAPTALRTKELTERSLIAMRMKVEECFDQKMDAGEATSHALLAIRLELANELDKEFPKIVLTES